MAGSYRRDKLGSVPVFQLLSSSAAAYEKAIEDGKRGLSDRSLS